MRSYDVILRTCGRKKFVHVAHEQIEKGLDVMALVAGGEECQIYWRGLHCLRSSSQPVYIAADDAPSTYSALPVTALDSSDARNSTA